MKVLQIWIGKKIPKEIESLMSGVRTICNDSGIEYVLISEVNFFKDANWISYSDIVKKMSLDKKIKSLLKLIPSDMKHHCLRSDILRLWYLSNEKDILYLDSDIMISKLPKLLKRMDAIGSLNSRLIDHNILYRCCKNGSVIPNILSEIIDKYSDGKLAPNNFWVFSRIQKYKGNFRRIGLNEYSHLKYIKRK